MFEKLKALFASSSASRTYKRAHQPSIPIFAVYRVVGSKITGDPLYYASTRDDALTYISRLIQLSHAAHYSEWCRLHNTTPGFPSQSWITYANEVIGDHLEPQDTYAVAASVFSPTDMATFMRMLSNSAPGFLPCETDDEIVAYLASYKEKGEDIITRVNLADPSVADRVKSISDKLSKIKV